MPELQVAAFTRLIRTPHPIKMLERYASGPAHTRMENAGQTRNFDELLDALASVQRRRLLVALLVHNPQDEAPPSVAEEGKAAEVERLVKMEHVHLPKLDEYGFIDWDREANEVNKGERFEEVRPLLELLADHEEELPNDWL